MVFRKSIARMLALGRSDNLRARGDRSRVKSPLVWPYYYLGKNRALTQLSNGLPFYVNTDDRYISPWIIRGGIWETFVDRVLMRLSGPGMRVCDVGANLGYYTVKLAHRVGPEGFVLAIEPNPDVYEFLHDNIVLNGYSGRVDARQLALGSTADRLTLNYHPDNLGSGNLFGLAAEHDPYNREVEVATLDSLTEGQPGFDLIKIDVEGWELEVLRGMSDTLARSRDASIVIEVSWESWSRLGDPEEALRSLIGDRDGVFIIHQTGALERVPVDNLARFNTIGVCYALLTPWRRTEKLLHDIVAA